MRSRLTLGLLVDQLVSGYCRLLIEGVSQWCREQDASLVVFSGRSQRSPHGFEYQNAVIYDSIGSSGVDALVVATGTQLNYQSLDDYRAYLERFGAMPLVSVGIRMEGVPSVLVDNRNGILEAMRHLAGVHGFRRVAFLQGPQWNDEARARLAAYREALGGLGLDEDPQLCLRGDFSEQSGYLAMKAHLVERGGPDFDALLAANDDMAIGALRALRESGREVPRDVAVVGFDDVALSQFALPPLTTVAQPIRAQARLACDAAASLLRGEGVPPELVLPTTLVLRASCGCLPRSVTELEAARRKAPRPAARGPRAPREALVDRCLARVGLDRSIDPGLAAKIAVLLDGAGSQEFLPRLQTLLIEEIAAAVDVTRWQGLLTAAEEELAGALGEPAALAARFEEARVLLAEMLRLERGRACGELLEDLELLRHTMESLLSASSTEDLMASLADQLGHLDIRSCFVVAYPFEIRHPRDGRWTVPPRAELLLAWVDGRRLPVAGLGSFSPREHLVPPSYLPSDRRYTLIATSAFFRESQIGYILLEPGSCDNAIYETFCVQLASLLHGSLLATARQRAEAALRGSLAQWQATFDAVSDSIVLVDGEGRILQANAAAIEIFGPLDSLRGRQCCEILHGVPSPLEGCPLERMRVSRERESMDCAIGGRSFVESADPIVDGRGALAGAVLILRDVTAHRTLEGQLRQALKMESVGRLAGGVAHDFNNMLTVILGHAGVALSRLAEGDPLRQHLEGILEAGTKSADLVNQLLAFARKQAISPVVLDLNETVSGLLTMLRRLIGEDIELEWQPGEDLWRVQIDPLQVSQLLVNLAANARDAIAGSGTVTIRTANVSLDETWCASHPGSVPGQYALLQVSDTGCGMDREVMEHLFEPFFTTKGGKGTGLGLSTVYGIVKQNAGYIDVASEPGRGARFDIYLPRTEAPAAAARRRQTYRPARGNETLLLVEDEEGILALEQTVLEGYGYRVLAAHGPSEALALAEASEGPIHLLVTDVVMPGMNGRELAERLQRLKPGLKTLFVSGYAADVIAGRGVLLEGVRFLQKPFAIDALAERIREVLDS